MPFLEVPFLQFPTSCRVHVILIHKTVSCLKKTTCSVVVNMLVKSNPCLIEPFATSNSIEFQAIKLQSQIT